ncbi:MAG TPA: ATP-dependent RecD-like DNA helicase [Ruminococcaceae bacterium]|nr:ATP-dependent RecD-like DNA helicase [Oscillospiraceae bacterium]
MKENLEEIHGFVEELVFRKPESGFTVLELSTDDEYVTVVGVLPEINVGEDLKLRGTWNVHQTFGRQFKAELCERSLPSTAADLYRYLASGAVKGIGPKTAQKIIERFGDEAFEVLEKHPKSLAMINGISLSKAEKICKEFNEQFSVRQVMIALEKLGMTASECLKVYRLFGANSIDVVRINPYVLCGEGIGIGFERAEQISEALEVTPDPQFRIQAGVMHVIRHNIRNGHTCLPREKLIAPSCGLLNAAADDIEIAIDNLLDEHKLEKFEMNGKEFIALFKIYSDEFSAAERIKVFLRFPPAGRPTLLQDIENIERDECIVYDEKQKEAIIKAVEKGILILTGGPGTGKTTTLNGILRLFESDGLDVVLTAPTGRAAKRMSEITGREAKTIHRLLEVEWDKNDNPHFKHNMQDPLKADAVIVDELSMVDISLFSSLLNALPLGCRLVMVGDSDQLPAVGAGNVLHDLIKSETLPVVELKKVFRQAMKSRIVTNAHDIVAGKMPDLETKDNDFFFMKRNNSNSVVATIAELCSKRLPDAYGFDPFNDIQVLCPSRKGECGSVNINKVLQAVLNPPSKSKREVSLAGKILREGDKVMQIKNNYDILWTKGSDEGNGIFNGDIGIIEKIDNISSAFSVNFEDRIAVYSFENANEIEHAYAITVHKSQGNEFKAVVMPVFNVIPNLCYRNLLYTAVTRAKNIMVLIGSADVVYNMTANNSRTKRYTALKHFLTESEDEDE